MSDRDRWLGVEVRHLVALEAVVAARSFVGAARRLGYTQSAVSLQIAGLERIAGSRLLERRGGRHPVVPTPAGERVLRHARHLLDELRATEADLTALAAGEAGRVSVGTFQSAAARLLPGTLRRLRASHPLVEVRLDEAPHAQQLERLAAGQTDVAFALLPVEGPFEARELLRDPFLFIAARQRPPSAGRLPSLAQLARMPLISWQRGPFTLEVLLRGRGHDPHIVLRSDDSATVQGLVAAGLGAAVLPRLALHLPDPRLLVLDASRHLPPRSIGLAWRHDRELTPVVLAFVHAVEAEVAAAGSRMRRPPGTHPDGLDRGGTLSANQAREGT